MMGIVAAGWNFCGKYMFKLMSAGQQRKVVTRRKVEKMWKLVN
jgi:hypothetical protein